MLTTWGVLLSSRKFWIGFISLAATAGAVLLRALDKIPADALIPTISAITATGVSVVMGIAWEDASQNKASTRPPEAPVQTVTVNANATDEGASSTTPIDHSTRG